jgi:hypothetical protein
MDSQTNEGEEHRPPNSDDELEIVDECFGSDMDSQPSSPPMKVSE